MQLRLIPIFLFVLGTFFPKMAKAQHKNEITATLDNSTKEINITQRFTYVNESDDGLSVLYFNDWNHAFANKKTALAKRFGEEFNRSLHLAKDRERGYTTIKTIVDNNYTGLNWTRVGNQDFLRVELSDVLDAGQSIQLFFTYTVKLPNSKFTSYGHNPVGEYFLKDWYLTPAVYDEEWKLYNNMDLDDHYTEISNTTIKLTFPEKLFLATNFSDAGITNFPGGQYVQLSGNNRKNCEIHLTQRRRFTKHITEVLTVTTDLEAKKYDNISEGISISKVAKFLKDNLGEYPHENLLVSELDYSKHPLYGINQLPSFIRPYEEQFQFELKFLKTSLRNYLKETLFLDRRAERWVADAIVNYLMIKYVEEYYPDQKLVESSPKYGGFEVFIWPRWTSTSNMPY